MKFKVEFPENGKLVINGFDSAESFLKYQVEVFSNVLVGGKLVQLVNKDSVLVTGTRTHNTIRINFLINDIPYEIEGLKPLRLNQTNIEMMDIIKSWLDAINTIFKNFEPLENKKRASFEFNIDVLNF